MKIKKEISERIKSGAILVMLFKGTKGCIKYKKKIIEQTKDLKGE